MNNDGARAMPNPTIKFVFDGDTKQFFFAVYSGIISN
jgi:hypothetical protein